MPDITIYDEISISEDIGLLLDSNISIYDSTVVSETVITNLTHNISVYDNITVIENISLINITFFGTDTRLSHYPKLPTVSCEATFRESIQVEGEVPTVECVGYFGSSVIGKVPVPSSVVIIQGLYAGYISVAGNLPITVSAGFFGGVVEDKVPTVSCTAILANRDIAVSGYAPVISAEIVIPNNFITISEYTPFPSVQAELTVDGYITVTGIVPVAIGSILISEAVVIAINGIAPVTRTEYDSMTVGSSSIDILGIAPVVSMYYPTGEEDPGGITIMEEERFADITLQYKRWPDAV